MDKVLSIGKQLIPGVVDTDNKLTFTLEGTVPTFKGYRLDIYFQGTVESVDLNDLVMDGQDVTTATIAGSGTGLAQLSDGNPATFWTVTSDASKLASLSVLFSTANAIEYMEIAGSVSNTNNIIKFVVYGSNDTTDGSDGTWTILGKLVGPETGDFVYHIPLNEFSRNLVIGMTDDLGTFESFAVKQSDVLALMNDELASGGHVQNVADITTRDSNKPLTGMFVYVEDASGDPVISSGAALYYYDDESDTFSLYWQEGQGLSITEDEWV